ncbi:MAG: malonate decarboxylase acyl carrier protein [Candidatus Aureabacteria bacterium]|nr:malonate decarboxylase acyl carrier protein [Candidatus Auribacterota bacterium]
MEKLDFTFRCSGERVESAAVSVLVGVVSSGNLEVFIEKGGDPSCCRVEVATSHGGFERAWRTLFADFLFQYDLSGYAIWINDAGAVPAVVKLRLHQAVEELMEKGR